MKPLIFLMTVALLIGSAAAAPLTYTRDIAPIVYANCVSCHRTGEVAPFSLLTYADFKKHSDQIVEVTQSRFMPPWKAEEGFGHFVGERRLTDTQIKTISEWAKQGETEGDAKDLPAMPSFPQGWTLGQPDIIIKIPTPFTLKADGNNGHDVYRGFVVPLNLTEDKYVTAVEFRPSNRKIVHHAILYLDSSGAARKKELATKDGQPGYETFGGPGFIPTGGLGGWAPGAMPTPLPQGWAKLLRKGSDLVIQTHFHPIGKEETEQSSVGIYFAKQKPEHIAAGLAVSSFRINIPAGQSDYVVRSSMTVPVDIEVVGVTPHAHLICKDMQATATLPGGEKKPLIWIKDWDFNWQGEYRYETPLKLPAGTVVDIKYTYDNSDKNLHNPSTPPKRVHFGEQTTDEMAFLFMQVTPEKISDWPKLIKSLRSRLASRAASAFGGAAPDGSQN